MAQSVVTTFVDDIDGTEAEGTIVFGLDSRTFEIDLSEQNAAKLREVFAPYVGVARKVGSSSSRPVRRSSVSGTSREDAKAIRDWAIEHGMQVSTRGRISSNVVEAYKARGEKPAVAEPEETAPVKKPRARAKAKQPEFSSAQ